MGAPPAVVTPGQPGPMQPGEFASASIPNFVTFALKGIGPPSTLYVQRDDQILVQAASNQAAESVVFNLRLLLVNRDGSASIQSIQFTNTPPSLRVAQSLTFPLAEGYLLSVTANAAVATQRGQTFARAWINRGGPVATRGWYTMLADYVTLGNPISWPGGRVISPVEGPGWLRVIAPAVPAPGVNWSFVLLAGQRLRLQSLRADLTTSAGAGSRLAAFVVTTSSGVTWIGDALSTQGPGVTTSYIGAPYAPYTPNALVTRTFLPFPVGLALSGADGDLVGTLTLNILAADQWSNIQLAVEEWLEV